MQDTNDTRTAPLALVPDDAEFTMHEPPATVDPWLSTILSYPRKHGTVTEAEFLTWLAGTLTTLGHKPTESSAGALVVQVPRPDGNRATTLFSCHVDTVDCLVTPSAAGMPSPRKKVDYDANFGELFLSKENQVGSCLGADDGVGVWILLKMIEAGVPGGYLFNRGEECGGISAKALVSAKADWLKGFDVCVEFDRPRFDEVITHQRGGVRCASDKFGDALATALNALNPLFAYKKSTKGVYTDCFEFRGQIAECVNLGVGYKNQHGDQETLDYGHALALMQACLKLNWEALPVDRTPVIELTPQQRWYKGVYDDDADWTRQSWWAHSHSAKQAPVAPPPPPKKKQKYQPPPVQPPPVQPPLFVEDDVLAASAQELIAWTEDETTAVVATLIEMATELKAMRTRCASLRDLLDAVR